MSPPKGLNPENMTWTYLSDIFWSFGTSRPIDWEWIGHKWGLGDLNWVHKQVVVALMHLQALACNWQTPLERHVSDKSPPWHLCRALSGFNSVLRNVENSRACNCLANCQALTPSVCNLRSPEPHSRPTLFLEICREKDVVAGSHSFERAPYFQIKMLAKKVALFLLHEYLHTSRSYVLIKCLYYVHLCLCMLT